MQQWGRHTRPPCLPRDLSAFLSLQTGWIYAGLPQNLYFHQREIADPCGGSESLACLQGQGTEGNI